MDANSGLMILTMLTLKVCNATRIEDLTLEEHLEKMAYYGKPRVSLVSNGWHSSIEMNTNTTGTTFEIRSDFDHASPLMAVKQCHERIVSVLKELSK